jgi:hypothetical protein
MNELVLMAVVMLGAGGVVGLVAWRLVRGADQPQHVSPRWIDAHIRERRDE